MKRRVWISRAVLSVVFLTLSLLAQELQYEAVAVNIEVPVRVFRGDIFVDDLIIEDFEVLEDGIPQKIEAVYLVKRNTIQREERAPKGEKAFMPDVSRNFILMFEIWEYLPKVEEAIDFFFAKVMLPGDSLQVVTPMKTYNFKRESMERLPLEVIGEQLKGKLRQDTQMGTSEYRSVVRELEDSLGDPELGLQRYKDTLYRMEGMRFVEEQKILDFAEHLKSLDGQKIVFMFYQKELLPEPTQQTLMEWVANNQDRMDIVFNIMETFEFYSRGVSFDVRKVKQVFADSSISIHFLFITKPPTFGRGITRLERSSIHYEERSDDIFSAFKEVAQATGGLTDSSANAIASFQRAVDASENYYLLYYTPGNYVADGKFRSIKVSVKGRNFKVLHRAGYLAN